MWIIDFNISVCGTCYVSVRGNVVSIVRGFCTVYVVRVMCLSGEMSSVLSEASVQCMSIRFTMWGILLPNTCRNQRSVFLKRKFPSSYHPQIWTFLFI